MALWEGARPEPARASGRTCAGYQTQRAGTRTAAGPDLAYDQCQQAHSSASGRSLHCINHSKFGERGSEPHTLVEMILQGGAYFGGQYSNPRRMLNVPGSQSLWSCRRLQSQ